MNEQLLSAPAVEPISIIDAKWHLNVEHDDDDPLINRMIGSARAYVEEHTRTRLVRQSWRTFMDYSLQEIDLVPNHVQEVIQVQYVDEDGATQTVTSSVYEVDIPRQRLHLAYDQVWPTTRHQRNAAWVDVWTGYYVATNSPLDLTGDIPADLRGAIYMLLDHLYENRGLLVPRSFGQDPVFNALIGPHRVMNR